MMLAAGIMSGTSLDGIDAVVVEIRGRRVKTLGFHAAPYPREVRDALLAVSNANTHTAQIARLDFLLPELYAEAVKKACAKAGAPPGSLRVAGCHGQTIFHEGSPVKVLGRRVASTMQIGNGCVLARRLGVPVVSDFRARDIAAGGQGAPLVPYVDYLLFRHRRKGRVALNIGGIANITAIPPNARPEQVIACDTGPGNMVIDGLVRAHTGGRMTCDRGGRLAARGRVNRPLLDELLRDPYYRRRPPKSAGREQYGEEFVNRMRGSGLPIEDLAATATALTAATIADAVRRFARFTPDEIIASGGGVHNPTLMGQLAAFLPGVSLASSAAFGIDPDAKEAVAFAVLAAETIRRRPSNLPSATGAREPVVLGKVSW